MPESKQKQEVLKLDNKGEAVNLLQYRLQILGFYKNDISGDFDKETEDAVRLFQKKFLITEEKKGQPAIELGVADSKTIDEIEKQLIIQRTKRRIGIPSLDPNTIYKLNKAGINSISQLQDINIDKISNQLKIDKELLISLKYTSELSYSTGLLPENAYALVTIGKIKSSEELDKINENDFNSIFDEARNKNMLSEAAERQIKLFIKHKFAPKKVYHNDLRDIFSKINKNDAIKLAEFDIKKGSDLRGIDVEELVKKTGIKKTELELYTKAAELKQIRGIDGETAFILVKYGQIDGLEGLAKLSEKKIKQKIKALEANGTLNPEVVSSLEARSYYITTAANVGTCEEKPCSERNYLDYLIGLWGNPDDTLEDKKAILTDLFKQDFKRSEADNLIVLHVDIVINVLEKIIYDLLKEKVNEIGIITENYPAEGYPINIRNFLNNEIKRLQDVAEAIFVSTIPDNSLWKKDKLPISNQIRGISYVNLLLELYVILTGIEVTKESIRKVLYYLSNKLNININTNDFKKISWLKQAALTLQEELCKNHIKYKTYSEWCQEIQINFFPENFIPFKLPLLSECKNKLLNSGDLSLNLNQKISLYSDITRNDSSISHFSKLTSMSRYIFQADDVLSEGHDSYKKMELSIALSKYNEVETLLFSILKEYVEGGDISDDINFKISYGNRIPSKLEQLGMIYSQFGYTYISIEELAYIIKTGIDNAWNKIPPANVKLMKDILYERYSFDYVNLITQGIDSYHDILEKSLFEPIDNLSIVTAVSASDRYSIFFTYIERFTSLIYYYLLFLLPILKGILYYQQGNYKQGYFYFNLIFNIENNQIYLPYLNNFIELPYIKICHGKNLIEWAESLYRENIPESIVQAKCRYKKVLELFNDCIPVEEDTNTAISYIVSALTNLNIENSPGNYSFSFLIKQIRKIKDRNIKSTEIPRTYRQIKNAIDSNRPEKTAEKLSKILNLDIHYNKESKIISVDTNINSLGAIATINNTTDSNNSFLFEALGNYEIGPLVELPSSNIYIFDDIPVSTVCKPPCNPVILAMIKKAQMRLSQIEQGLNILGYSDDMVPLLRYSYLINQAKMFVQLTVSAEKDFINFLDKAEDESLSQLQAQQAIAIASANIRVEQARVNIAQERIALATLQRDQVQQEIKYLKAELEDAQDQIFEDAEFAQASDEYASGVSFGYKGFNFSGTGANNLQGGGPGNLMGEMNSYTSSGDYRGWIFDPANTLPSKLFQKMGYGNNEPPIETRRKAQRQARMNQIHKLRHQLKLKLNFGLPIANKQIDIAVAEHELANRQLEVAQLQFQHAQQIYSFLQNKFLNKEMWYELAQEVKAIYRKLLDYAITTAFLAEQSLEYELNQRLNVIRFDYFNPGKQGLLGAENLQADIATLEYQKNVLTEKKKLPVKAVISLSEEYPRQFIHFIETGKTHFATDFSQFDHIYPGTYQSRISRVEVVVEGLIPAEGIHGSLSTNGISYTRTKENNVHPLMGNPDTMILSSYTIRGDQVVFYKTGEEYEVFEGLGVVTDWTFELPKENNNMNYRNITDVKLVIYYYAFFDENLKQYHLLTRPKSGDAYRGFSVRFEYPDEFYHFNNNYIIPAKIPELKFQDILNLTQNNDQKDKIELAYDHDAGNHIFILKNDLSLENIIELTGILRSIGFKHTADNGIQYKTSVSFITTKDYFPTNQMNRRIRNVTLMLASDQEMPQKVPFSLKSISTENGNEQKSAMDFTLQAPYKSMRVSSNVDVLKPDGTPEPLNDLAKLTGMGVEREWLLEILFEDKNNNQQEYFSDDENGNRIIDLSKIADILVFFEYEYDREDLLIAEHFFDESLLTNDNMRGIWKVENNYLIGEKGPDNMGFKKVQFPGNLADRLTDNFMLSFRTMAEDDNGDIKFFFVDGNYIFNMNKNKTSLLNYDAVNDRYITLIETDNPEYLMKAQRWYRINIYQFNSIISIEIDGATLFEVNITTVTNEAKIAFGTEGTGKVYFADFLI